MSRLVPRDGPGTRGDGRRPRAAGHEDWSAGGAIWDFGGDPNLGFAFGGCDWARPADLGGGGGSLASSAWPPGSPPQPSPAPKANAAMPSTNARFLVRMVMSPCDPGQDVTTGEAADPT